jgi:methenyltetrahydromethanopterin cyclohydrolase
MKGRTTLRLEDLNATAFALCERVIRDADSLDVRTSTIGGATVLDFAVGRTGDSNAGIELAKICLGGQADVERSAPKNGLGLDSIHVKTQFPLEACIGAQYAGWPLSHEKYFAMCSGPIRLLRGKEPILSAYDLKVDGGKAVGVLETNQLPSAAVVQRVADECGMNPANIVLCVARTASVPGSIQIVARSVETALHKLHELGFDLATIVEATGQAPLPPLPDDDMTALGWTNDSILYGAFVHLKISTTDDAINEVMDRLPSCSSSEFGTPFLELFRRYDHDFYKIDKMLFSPARITIANEKTGRVFEAGETRPDVLRLSFGLEPS